MRKSQYIVTLWDIKYNNWKQSNNMRYKVTMCDLKSQLWEFEIYESLQYEILSHRKTKSQLRVTIWDIETLWDIVTITRHKVVMWHKKLQLQENGNCCEI